MTTMVTRGAHTVRGVIRVVARGVACGVLVSLAAAGCAKARAASLPEAPPLAVPAPPPRVLAETPVEEPLAASPAGPDTTIAAEPRIPPTTPRPNTRRTPAADENREPPTPPAATAAPAAAASETPRELRTAPSSREAVPDQQRIQGLIDKAQRDLSHVDWQGLAASGREQYSTSQRYAKEASEALSKGNLLRAQESADKAARIAAALLGLR